MGHKFRPVQTDRRFDTAVHRLAFSPVSNHLAVGGWYQVTVLDGDRNQVINTIDIDGRSLVFSADGRRLIGGDWNGDITIWDISSQRRVTTLRGHQSTINSLAVSDDGARLVSGSDDTTSKIWDLRFPPEDIGESPGFLAISRDHRWIARRSGDNNVEVLDADSGQVWCWPRDENRFIETAFFSDDGSRLLCVSGLDTKTVTVWNVISGTAKVLFCGKIGPTAFSPDGRLVAACVGREIRVWDFTSGSELTPLRDHNGTIRAIAFGRSSRCLVSTGDGGVIRFWDPTSAQQIDTLVASQSTITYVKLSPMRRGLLWLNLTVRSCCLTR